MARVSKELQSIKEMIAEDYKIDEEYIESMEIDKDLILELQENAIMLSDTRDSNYIYHSVESILLIVILGILANCNTFVQIYLFMHKHKEWIKQNIYLDNDLPSLSTIKRVIGMIIPEELEELINISLSKHLYNSEPYYQDDDITINDLKDMDGKTMNSSNRNSSKNGKISKINAMSVYSVNEKRCEATKFISDKTNEIPTGVELLKKININGSIVLFDALSTQVETIKYIAEHKAFYVAPVKGNQSTLEENIKLFFDEESNYTKVKDKNYLIVKEKAHGVETREYCFSNDIYWLYQKDRWKDIKSIGYVKRTYYDSNGKKITDTRYFISNIDANKIALLSRAIRGEWEIENGLHLYLDMVFLEDKNKCFLGNSQKNLNIIRKFALALLKRYKITTNLSMNSIRFNISMDFEYEISNILKRILI